jgi:predicted TIM-barrel fold metal-dependent hydrolase
VFIALEEHFSLPDTLGNSEQYFTADVWATMKHRLLDIHEERVAEMDRHGIETMLLSLNAPGIQAMPDVNEAVEVARRANNYLAEQVARNPRRFQALAALPMQDPEVASKELSRAVKDLRFRGALVNGFTQIGDSAAYYDEPHYWPFWETAEKLDVPFYLHPREPLDNQRRIYEGHPWFLGSAWSFGRGIAIQHLARRPSNLEDAPRHPGAEADGGIFAREFLSDDQRQFSDANASRRHRGGRRRSHPVFGRLSLRGTGRGREMVQGRRHQRGRSAENRKYER